MAIGLRNLLDPITRKRLRRFREMKRAAWSAWLLAALFAVSLVAELVCNSSPLYVRYQGRSFLPVFCFYPDDTFTGSGLHTRPDYRRIAAAPAFAPGTGNRMVWPPFSSGPYEIVDPATIPLADEVEVALAAEPRVATVNLQPDLSVARGDGAGAFFGVADEAVAGRGLGDLGALPPDLRAAIEARFANREAGPLDVELAAGRGRVTHVSLSTYAPRSTAPKTVRLTLREPAAAAARLATVVFDRTATAPIRGDTAAWAGLPAALRGEVLAGVRERFDLPVDPRLVRGPQGDVRATFSRQEVRFPYGPVRGHWLGIDAAGRDVLARILYGLRTALSFGLILVVVSVGLGIVIGAVQGYVGGALDITAQRLIEVWSALPFLYVMILMGSVYGRSFSLLIVCYGLFNWIGMSYYMRAEFLRLRGQPFVEAARCLGLPARKIVFRHILPNALVPVITFLPFSLVGAIGSLAALDYLGFGLPPPTPSWGELLFQAQQFRWAWWLILYPSLALFVVMLLGVFIGEGIRNAYDPRRFSRME